MQLEYIINKKKPGPWWCKLSYPFNYCLVISYMAPKLPRIPANHCFSLPFLYDFEILRLTITNFLFAVTRPTQKNCPYPKFFIGLPEKDFFFISSSQIQFFNFFSISLQKCLECAVVNKGVTERGINVIPFFNSYLKSLPFN